MSTFEKTLPPKFSKTQKKEGFKKGLWVKCPSCQKPLFSDELKNNLFCCFHCNHHFRPKARERIEMIVDKNSFVEKDKSLKSVDPLAFEDQKKYADRILEYKNHAEKEAFIYGSAHIKTLPIVLGSFVFEYMGGSMGSVVGEKMTRTFELAIKEKKTCLIITASGGARMQEGILSLMQMAKLSAGIRKMRKAGIPLVVLLTDPTTGGVAASVGMLGDVLIAEPNALIGFAGPRVIEQTIRQTLPTGFQRSEFLLEHGMIDQIVQRKDLRDTLFTLLTHLSSGLK